ncbi:hypothetical protein GUITHDRAFT_154676 [Guillardia theta CCMP2712]|uniref:Mitochondrial import receptor subunit TOM7 homolog n=1 Tax=Guillardia theta (strain CCMP2712) TaxID=905079 RepID=L1IQH7_GUITC|nr:hypothetical protein GUITHDRAFT_154676 [Guillardia theta CCMP2712]EKX38508.1 hypothetical protein GUITHDRAFT_154676 [Guillardia theta CCMP2712]|eukprot:XP_005825488.1 hypothetical protein GUITHDRAFT_154676 [Guillardia theta CCMP2712]
MAPALPAPPGSSSFPHLLNKSFSSAVKVTRTVVHYGFVPFVLYLGFQSETKPGVLQLFLPI